MLPAVVDLPPQLQERVVCSIAAATKYRIPANIVLAVAEGDVPAVVATGDGAGHVTRPSLARQRELARYLDPVQL